MAASKSPRPPRLKAKPMAGRPNPPLRTRGLQVSLFIKRQTPCNHIKISPFYKGGHRGISPFSKEDRVSLFLNCQQPNLATFPPFLKGGPRGDFPSALCPMLYALSHFITRHLCFGQVFAIPQERLQNTKVYKYMILLSFYYSSDHFRPLFPILSVEKHNFPVRSGAKLHFNSMKFLEKT
jgi:hypothetical protein